MIITKCDKTERQRFPHRGRGFTSQYAPVGWICNDFESNPLFRPEWGGRGVVGLSIKTVHYCSDRGSTKYQRQVNIFSFNPQFAFFCSHDFCVVKAASKMSSLIILCSNSTWECHNKLPLYLLNNKILSYLVLGNTDSVLRTESQIKSRTLFHVELLNPLNTIP